MSTKCNFMPDNLRPKYIVLFKGDDTNFPGNQNISLVIDTELDLTGMKAHFRFMDFVQDFNEITENKTLYIVIPHEKTSAFPLGSSDATLTLEDPSGKVRTISNRIHVVVTNSVREAYDNEDSQSVTVTVKGTVTWDMIEGKPDIPSEFPEPSDDYPRMDGEASAGESTEYSRGDHKHPSDTSKRDINDLGVIGEPQGAGSWFTVNGRQYNYESGVWNNQYDSSFIERASETYRYRDGDQGIEFVFTLDNGVYTGDRYVIIGYVDTIAEVSQIPAVDSSLTEPGAAADAKVVGDALRDGFTEWEFSGGSSEYPPNPDSLSWSEISNAWIFEDSHYEFSSAGSSNDDIRLLFPNIFCDDGQTYNLVATRHLITPTKTSQLENDGAPNGGGTPYATTAQIPNVTGKADKVAGATEGNLASLTAQGNLADSGVKPSDFAAKADLPYRLVEPGKWEFSEPQGLTNFTVTLIEYDNGHWTLYYTSDETTSDTAGATGSETDLTVTFRVGIDQEYTVTATRASLPGNLCDRAGNRVVVSGDTTLQLPAANPGYLRDFLVRLEISGSTVPTITFAAPTGETIVYETDGDEFPVPDEAGDWLYSFTESCVAHKFAVSLKKVNTVAAPQAQGGS